MSDYCVANVEQNYSIEMERRSNSGGGGRWLQVMSDQVIIILR